MIESIDSSTVCAHCKALLSNRVPQDLIHSMVGFLNSLEPETFEAVTKDLATVFTGALIGNFDIPKSSIPTLALRKSQAQYTDFHGKEVCGNRYRREWINAILDLEPNPETIKIWSGLTNLKSACVIKSLSRSEKDEAYAGIAHTTNISSEFLTEWEDFVVRTTGYIMSHFEFGSSRENIPFFGISYTPTKHTTFLDTKGRVATAKRGSLRSMHISDTLKHPEINRIFREYTYDAACAVFYGNEVDPQKVDFWLPNPFDFEPPVGKVGIAPKIAQKSRVVFEPLALLDVMSRPLFQVLSKIEDQWTIQGVMSHDKSRELIKRELFNNSLLDTPSVFCSYDQSAYTDNLDYRIQRPILKQLMSIGIINAYDLEVVDLLNHGLWDATALDHATVRFGTGTGMGTPPSFPLASITNGYLVYYAYNKVFGKIPNPLSHHPIAQVVGDDVCIFNADVGNAYEQLCETIGLKINKTKSFRSDYLAEFCGKIITSYSVEDKHKLMPNNSYSGITHTALYYKEQSDEFFRNLGDPVIWKGYMAIKDWPQPIGPQPPVDETVGINELNAREAVTRTLFRVQEMKGTIPDMVENRPSIEDWQQLIRRKTQLPAGLKPSSPIHKDTEQKSNNLPLSPLEIEMARNAVNALQTVLAQHGTLDEFYKVGELVDLVYHQITEADRDRFRKNQISSEHIAPSRSRGEANVIERFEQFLLEIPSEDGPPSNEKGGMSL